MMSWINLSSRSPMQICAHSLRVRPGRPLGSAAVRNGLGPPSNWRAAVYVSQGRPPPAATVCPAKTRSVHQRSALGAARSALHAYVDRQGKHLGASSQSTLIDDVVNVIVSAESAKEMYDHIRSRLQSRVDVLLLQPILSLRMLQRLHQNPKQPA